MKAKANTQEKEEFLKGVLSTCHFLVIGHNEDALRESGFTKNKFLLCQRKTEFHNRRMNKIIKNAFRKK